MARRRAVGPRRSAASIALVELEHTDGGWKVTDETVADGPMPLNGGNASPVEDASFEAALDGFGTPPQP